MPKKLDGYGVFNGFQFLKVYNYILLKFECAKKFDGYGHFKHFEKSTIFVYKKCIFFIYLYILYLILIKNTILFIRHIVSNLTN